MSVCLLPECRRLVRRLRARDASARPYCPPSWPPLARALTRRLEASEANTRNVLAGLRAAGIPAERLGSLDVLEIGSGPGAVTRHLLPLFRSVHSIDTSPSMLRTLSRQAFPHSDRLSWSLHALGPDSAAAFAGPLPSPRNGADAAPTTPPRAQFDAAVSTLTVHHVDDIAAFLAGACALLRPGGVLVICEFTTDEDGNDVLAALRAKYGPGAAHDHAHDHGHDHGKDHGHGHDHGHGAHEGSHGGDSASKGYVHDRGHGAQHGHAHHAERVEREEHAEEGARGAGSKTVNAPMHFHPAFTVATLRKPLEDAGFVDVAGGRAEPVVIPKFNEQVPCIWVYARKPADEKEGSKGD